MEKQRAKPSGWLYGLGLAILLFGCVGAIVVFGFGVVGMVDSAIEVDEMIGDFDRVVMPGSAQLTLEEAGLYTVFYEYRTELGGIPYNSSSSRPQLNCQLEVKATGERVPLTDAWNHESDYELMNRSGSLLMSFDIDRPDTYVLTCNYAGNRKGPDVVLAVGTGFVRTVLDLAIKALGSLFVPFLLVCGTSFIALVVVVAVAIMRNRAGRAAA